MSEGGPKFEKLESKIAHRIEAGPEYKPELEPELWFLEIKCKYYGCLQIVLEKDIIHGTKNLPEHFLFQCKECKLLQVIPSDIVEQHRWKFDEISKEK